MSAAAAAAATVPTFYSAKLLIHSLSQPASLVKKYCDDEDRDSRRSSH